MNQIFTSKRLFKKTSILNWSFGVLEVHKHKVTSAKLEGFFAELGNRAGPGIYTGRIGSSALVGIVGQLGSHEKEEDVGFRCQKQILQVVFLNFLSDVLFG